MLHELSQSFATYNTKRAHLNEYLKRDAIQDEIRKIEAELEEPSFWDQNQQAQATFSKLKQLKATIEKLDNLDQQAQDIEAYLELLTESPDDTDSTELDNLIATFKETIDVLEVQSLLSGKFDANDCIVSLNSGAGGTDAQDWTDILLRMYCRWMDKKQYSYDIVEFTQGDEAGIKSATIYVHGPLAYGHLKNEMGVHRLVRLSPFNANNKRQTSFASIDVIPDIPADYKKDFKIPSDELRIDTYRASGAGGQHVNKTDSAVRITHIPTNIVAQSQASRSQGANKETAMRMLESRLLQKMELDHKETLSELSGAQNEIAWGHQIRSYVFHPYQMVKDHRTDYETSQLSQVLDGDLDPFIHAQLKASVDTNTEAL